MARRSPAPVFLVLDASGDVLAIRQSHEQAAGVANEVAPGAWHDLSPAPGERLPNALSPQEALALSGLSPLAPASVLSLSLDEAYAAIAPSFQAASAASVADQPYWYAEKCRRAREAYDERVRQRLEAGKRPPAPYRKPAPPKGKATVASTLQTLVSPGSGLLSDNTKMHKRDPAIPPAMALGVTLFPEWGAFRGESVGGIELPSVQQRGLMVPGTPASTLCAYSSAGCRATCLVKSGQNQSDPRNNYTKFARAHALLTQPAAFMRVLLSGLRRYVDIGSYDGKALPKGLIRYVRLNVLSDIPWEHFAPWLFTGVDGNGPVFTLRAEDKRGRRARDAVADLRSLLYYDYTKVPGRRPPFYDLSFSYSGVNLPACDRELRRGRRVVIAFASPEYKLKRAAVMLGASAGIPEDQAWFYYNPLPAEMRDPGLLNGRELLVVDGDHSDVRPLDPASIEATVAAEPNRWQPTTVRRALELGRYVVGLRFKPPMHAVEGLVGAEKRVLAGAFVVAGHYVDTPEGPRYMLPDTPLSHPARSSGEMTALQV